MPTTAPDNLPYPTGADDVRVWEDVQALAEATQAALTALRTAAPLGEVAYAEVTADQGGITALADLAGLSVTFAAQAGRSYKITAEGMLRSTVNGDTAQLQITDAAGTTLQYRQVPATGANALVHAELRTAPGAGQVTYKLRAQRAAGTGTVTLEAGANSPAFILVEDLGPT